MSLPSTGLFTFVTCTATHVGGGDPHGEVDLAIFRERNTRLPAWPSTAFKGPLRRALKPPNTDEDAMRGWREMMGSESGDKVLHEGMLQTEDVRLLALPVPTPSAPVAWVTSPFLLARVAEACAAAGIELPTDCRAPDPVEPGFCLAGSDLTMLDGRLWLADLAFLRHSQPQEALRRAWAGLLAKRWYARRHAAWQDLMRRHLVIVGDLAMHHLSGMLEVRARIKVDDVATSAEDDDRNLWHEENLPDEALLWAEWSLQPLLTAEAFAPDLAAACRWIHGHADAKQGDPPLAKLPDALRIGGKRSAGRGRVRLGCWTAAGAAT